MSVVGGPVVSHVLDWPEVKGWLSAHGVDADRVISASIQIGRNDHSGLAAWMEVEWFKLDANGRMYVDPDNRDEAARGSSSIPLHSWPRLRPVAASQVG